MSERSPYHVLAQRIVREVLAMVETRGATAREARRLFRARHALTSIPVSAWYRAVRVVTGGGLLDLADARQPTLLDRGPRRRRKPVRKMKPADAS